MDEEGDRLALGDAVDDPAFRVDRSGTVVAANDATTAAFGASTGASVEELLGEAAGEEVRSVLDGSISGDLLDELTVSTDDDRWFEVHCYPSGEGVMAIAHEVTEDRRERERLQRRADVLEALPVPVYFLDDQVQLQYANPAVADLLESDVETVRESSAAHAMRPEDMQTGQRLVREMLSEDPTIGTSRAFEMLTYTADGKRLDCVTEMALLMDDGEFLGTVGTIRDVTTRRRERQRIAVLERVLRHNLRTQADVIRGHAERLRARPPRRSSDGPPDEDPGAATVDESSDRDRDWHVEEILAATDQLLEISHKIRRIGDAIIGPGKGTATRLAPIVHSHVEDLATEYPGVSFDVDVGADLSVLAGPAVDIVFEQLLENAVVHNDAADPWVGVETTTTLPSVDRDHTERSEMVVTRILDDGPGIPEQERVVVGGDTDVSPLKHSDGLGLWTASWIVQAYNGWLRIEDRDPRGTAVEVLLPPAGE